jgi:hypothetical protein
LGDVPIYRFGDSSQRANSANHEISKSANHFAAAARLIYSLPFAMYSDFRCVERWSGKEVHCMYQALIVAIATRHADAVDIKFLVDGHPVWIALPHPAWVEYHQRTGKALTDPLAVEAAGHYLKWAVEAGENGGREMHSLSVGETLCHVDAVLEAERAALQR